jgi:hypothetical protein
LQDSLLDPLLKVLAPFNLLLLIWFCDTVIVGVKVTSYDRNTLKTNRLRIRISILSEPVPFHWHNVKTNTTP